MACVASTRVLGGWLWSRRSRWPCHGMSKVSVLFIDGGTHRKSGFVIGRYGNMILAIRGASSALHSHLPPSSFRRGPLSSLGTLLPHPHHRALQPSPERERKRESPYSSPSIPKDEYHFASRHGVQDLLRSAWNFIFDGLRFADERKTEPSVHLLPSSSMLLSAYLWILFCHLFYSFFFFLRSFCEYKIISKDSEIGKCVLRILLSWKEFRNSFDSSNDDVIWVKMFIFEILYNAWLYKL